VPADDDGLPRALHHHEAHDAKRLEDERAMRDRIAKVPAQRRVETRRPHEMSPFVGVAELRTGQPTSSLSPCTRIAAADCKARSNSQAPFRTPLAARHGRRGPSRRRNRQAPRHRPPEALTRWRECVIVAAPFRREPCHIRAEEIVA
jgi:hypothetical protein